MKIKQTLLLFALLIGFGGLFVGPVVSAASCGGVTTSILSCEQKGGTCSDGSVPAGGKCPRGVTYTAPKTTETGLWGILLTVINILTAGVGVAAVGGIVYGSVMYTSAGGSPDQVKQARMIITNTIIGIATYALMFSFLNFLIPGGLFN